MDYEKFIIDTITKLSGKYTPYQVFSDWIMMTAIAIQNACQMFHDKLYEDREEQYRNAVIKYSGEERMQICNMTGALTNVFETRFGDILGDIYMKAGCGNKHTGQFFTPYHISLLNAKLTFNQHEKELAEGKTVFMLEPSTGAGGAVIAFSQVMKDHGYNYQRQLKVVAQDIDWNGVYMTYVQCSMLGIKATVVQGDTLREPYKEGYEERRVFRTPAEMGVLL